MPASSPADPARPRTSPRALDPTATSGPPTVPPPAEPTPLRAVLPLAAATAPVVALAPPGAPARAPVDERPVGTDGAGVSGTYVPLDDPLVLGATRLAVRPWVDPVLEQFGHDARSTYVERFWLAILGPSATLLMRHLAARFDDHPAGYELDLEDTARLLGIGSRQQTGAPIVRVVERVVGFGFVRVIGDSTLLVRQHLPSLTRRQVQRLPRRVQRVHDEHLAAARHEPPPAQNRQRAGVLAVTLLDLGEDLDQTERQLHRWGFHPAIAHEAVQWARLARDHRPGAPPAPPPAAGDTPLDAA